MTKTPHGAFEIWQAEKKYWKKLKRSRDKAKGFERDIFNEEMDKVRIIFDWPYE